MRSGGPNVLDSLERIRERLSVHRFREEQAHPGSTFEAAVALILHEAQPGRPELLFIERAQREGDPWSGHMAFPGGRREPGDPDRLRTALRETFEEVGFEPARPLGRLDDVRGARRPRVDDLLVSAYVFGVDEPPRIVASPEVQSTVWVPLAWIADPGSWTEHVVRDAAGARRLPALRHDRYVIWGLTLRILESFFATLGQPLELEPPAGT
jgi:8-oxo-dGTP pyrophosphatase MutT (NUDIX family)